MDAAAPWHLTGRGFILMYRFQDSFIRENCFLPEEWKETKWSGMGYVMLVDYQDTPVGPYKELLVIPGKSRLGGSRLATNPGAHAAGQIRGACRIPQWLADWVMKEGDGGRKIEKTLIEYYGLVPPANTVVISSRA